MDIGASRRTTITRTPDRACHDQARLYEIIDEAIVGHVAFSDDESIHSIPMLIWRIDDAIFCHCAEQSRLLQLAANKQQVCISFSIIDGFVLAKAAFKHSVNYRSVVVYGEFAEVAADDEKLQALKQLVDHMDNKRWEQIRIPNQNELNATAVLTMPLSEAAVKIRSGPPTDIDKDRELDVWAGVIPRHYMDGDPIQADYE